MKFASEYVSCVLNENFEDAKAQFLQPLMSVHRAHLVMQPAVERAVGRNQPQARAQTQRFGRGHGGTDAECSNGVAGCGNNAPRRRPADGDRLAGKARIFHDGRRREHCVDVAEQDLTRPSGHPTTKLRACDSKA